MIRAAIAALAIVPVLAAGGLARAQSANNQIAYGAVMKAPVGAWADYVMTRDEHEAPVKVRYTLTDRSARLVAIELDSTTPGGRVLVRMEYVPDGAARWRLKVARMKQPDGQVRELPTPAGRDEKSAGFGKGDAFGDRVGTESLRVGAGTFQADHWKRGATEVWMDEKAFPVGMVRLVDASGSTVEMIATGRGGKSGF